jgi:NAD(P)H dehydrogenase (quinone)
MNRTTTPIAVTGSTGNVGGLVARHLADRGTALRLLVRDRSRAPHLPDADVRQASYADAAAARQALTGVRVLFMVSGSESADRRQQHHTFVQAAADAGVEHVVYTSFLGAAPDATFTLGRDHFATEEWIRASGMAFTFLRDSFYLDFLPRLVGEDGVIRGPAGQGRVGAVARADVARVAAHVLGDPERHAGQTYDLTGREAVTLDEVARTITDVTGRPTRYHEETTEEAYASRAHYGAPDWQVDAWVSTYTAIADGDLANINDNVAHLTGTPAMTLAEHLRSSGNDM